MEADTDTLLVMLESLLESRGSSSFRRDQLLEALLSNDGNVERAASDLAGEGSSRSNVRRPEITPGRKTKKKVSLRNWLIKPPSTTSEPRTPARRKRSASPTTIEVLSDSDEDTKAALEAVLSPSKKPKLMLTDVLRAPPSVKPTAPRLPPMTLGTPTLIAAHTPCTLHTAVLPPELACRVFYRMLDESEAHWRRSKWYLVDKLVESPHLTSFYVRDAGNTEWDESAKYWYNGMATPKPPSFPPELEEACAAVEKVVNAELAKRERYGMEWGAGQWKANVAAANRYKGAKEGVGFHADQLTYLGPYPTIASLSLGTERTFRLRETIPKEEKETRAARTYNISLPHNSLIIMHAGCQEHFKHTIPILPGTGIDAFRPTFPRDAATPIETHVERINATFRFFRPDFTPQTTPKCKCGVPMVLRAHQKAQGRVAIELGKAAMRYVWGCNAAGQSEGKSCGTFRALDMEAEGRGPCISETVETAAEESS